MVYPSPALYPSSLFWPGGSGLRDAPPIDLPTPMVIQVRLTNLRLQGGVTEVTIDGD